MPVPPPMPPLRPTGRPSPAHEVLIPWPAALAAARAADAAYLAADRELAAAQEASVAAAATPCCQHHRLAHDEEDGACTIGGCPCGRPVPPDPVDDDREAPEDADEAAPAHEYDGPTYDELPWWTFR